MELRLNKAALLDALEKRRQWATQRDKQAMTKHRADEKAALAAFRKKLRDALKWDYKTATQKARRYADLYMDAPSCPRSAVQQLDRAIQVIRADGRKKYVIKRSGWTQTIHWLLTHDDNATENLCD